MNTHKENTRICCMCGSSPSKDLGITLHRFPKPGPKNALRCELWAKYCFPNEAWFSLKFQNGVHSKHKMLCSKHFIPTCFHENKLFRTAVPGVQCLKVSTNAADPGPVKLPTDYSAAGDSGQVELPTYFADAGDSGPVEETTVEGTDICDDNDDDSDTLVESNVCRVCLALDVKMYDLKDIELREMFQNITGIVVTENNHSMLERLCWECAGRLKAAAAFRNKALLSDALLQGLASTGEQIRKNDLTLIKENQDYLKSAGTLSTVEVFHTVDINAEYGSIRSVSENDDTDKVQNTVRKHLVELKQVIINENNDQMDVEDELTEAPIKPVIEYDTISPNTDEKITKIVLEPNPTLSNSADNRHTRRKKITKKYSSKIVSKKSKEVINHDHTLQEVAKLKNMNFKVYGSSKKTSNQKLMEKTQKPNTSPDEEYTDVEYLSFENYEF